jgi:hypothetical protein
MRKFIAVAVAWALLSAAPAWAETVTSAGASAAGQITGTATNDDAAAGKVGEYQTNDLPSGTPTSISNSTSKTVCSMSLTAGDWDVSFVGGFQFTGGTSTIATVSTSLVNNTVDSTLGRFVQFNPAITVASPTLTAAVPARRFSLSSTTTVYGVVFAIFTAGTATAFGNCSARRVR